MNSPKRAALILAFCFGALAANFAAEAAPPAALTIQHPLAGAVMPFNMPPPVVLWKTNAAGVVRWTACFRAGRREWTFDEIAPMWRPPENEWQQIKEAAKGDSIELVLAGCQAGHPEPATARGTVRFSLLAESLETPLFFRDVNLPFIDAVKDPSKIRWRFGGIGSAPPVVLEHLVVCGNCHSFSRNGEYLAMDVDYANDKGSYIITRTAPQMRLATSDIITWGDYRREDGQETLGLLSQISPDGRHVLSTVKDLSVFMPKPELAFSQLFFPFMGIIGVYDRQTKQFSSLPGADDPALVQSNPTWSPDGQWVVFARTRAVMIQSAKRKGRLMLSREESDDLARQTAEYRYDLYRMPFNGGKGGKPEPIRGASANSRSNYFPKYSPDGRWIVFCQASNYMLLQPDSQLFIIPAEGGEARRLACNFSRMNSWHTWSPDGRWLVFTSKEHSDYTQLYLTRITERGEASPAVWLAHMIEPNRVANIPEFVNMPAIGIAKIHEQFLDDYSYIRAGDEFLRAREPDNAIAKYQAAVGLNPNNLRAREMLGLLLLRTNAAAAMENLEAAVSLNPTNPITLYALGTSFAARGSLSNAVGCFEAGVRCLPNADAREFGSFDPKHRLPELLWFKLGLAYEQTGRAADAEHHYREAVGLAPDYPEAQFGLGALLLRVGKLGEAEAHLLRATTLAPDMAQAHNCLGILRMRQDRKAEALPAFQHAVQCDPKEWRARLNLASAYLSQGERDQGIAQLQEILRLDPGCEPARQILARVLGSAK